MRKGAPAGEFKSFAELWGLHKPGDEIVVHGNGPFLLPRVQVKDRGLVLKAAPGFRAMFHPDWQTLKNACWLEMWQGWIEIEGCDFSGLDASPPAGRGVVLIGGEAGSSCSLRNCRVIGCGLAFGRFPSLAVEDCLLLLNRATDLPPGCEATLTNNVIWGDELFWFDEPGGQTVRLTHNTLLTGKNWLRRGDDAKKLTRDISIVAEGNVSQSIERCWRIDDDLKDRFRWRGKDNCYAGLWNGPDKKAPGFELWNRQLAEPETGSREVPDLRFAWRTGVPGDAAAALAWWQSRLTRARASSGLDDLGPDMSLVGAGEAYVRALAADGHPVAKESLRPEPLPGGPFVLIREGKDPRGFMTLAPALAAVADGDIIEIRSDRPQDSGRVPDGRGSITLRAAPGYRPAIAKWLDVGPGTRLALEGLTFPNGSKLYSVWQRGAPLAQRGRCCRLASCTFDGCTLDIVVAGEGASAAGSLPASAHGGPRSRRGRNVHRRGHPPPVTRHPASRRDRPLPVPRADFVAL